MRPIIFLFTLFSCVILNTFVITQSINATNYAMSLPGGALGTESNIDISGVPLNSLPYTIEFWVKINQSQVQYAGLVYHRVDATINSGVQFAATWQMGATPNAIRINNNTSGFGLISDTVTLNSWHHIAVVITNSGRTCYVDGHKTTQNTTIPTYDFSLGRMWLGRDSANATNDNRVFKGLLDEVRIWNVAKTETELSGNKYLTLTGSEPGLVGYWNFNDSSAVHATDLSPSGIHGKITGGTYVRSTPIELMTAVGHLSIGDVSAVESNLTLPSTAEGGVKIRWTTTNASVLDTLGIVNRPEMYDATVNLTATLSLVSAGVTYTLSKTFIVTVKSVFEAAMQVAKWDFVTENISMSNGVIKVKDSSPNAYSATVMNDASIRTIGITEKFNVLDLGNGTGHLDMGTEIGKAIYSLSNYTIFGYFRIDDDYEFLDSNGNFYWTFSNTKDPASDKTGYMISSLMTQSQSVSRMNNTIGNEWLSLDSNATKGSWHHIAYTQSGTDGTIYIDGVLVATGTITNIPSTALTQPGKTGTLYNWLGRSPYSGDAYLRKTLLYDFQLWRDAMSNDDLNIDMQIAATLEKLNNAYAENPNFLLPELTTEQTALSLGTITALTGNITLPSKGTLDPSINILWKSSHSNILSTGGVVNRPDYFPMNVKLTATLFKNGQSVTKEFVATVLEKTGTAFTGNLLVRYDFSNTSDTVVTDLAEKHFKGALMNDASIRIIGETTQFKVLDLGDSIGYFDMGTEVGKLMYHLNDYTISTYYRIDTSYHSLGSNGNFLYTFSNSDKAATDQNGYIFAGLNTQSHIITPGYYTAASGQQGVSIGTAPITGSWHNMTYVQKADSGYLYIDGVLTASDTITNKPSISLVKDNLLGTPYNWIGRSNYVGDVYLRNTLVHDFRLYRTALTEEQIQTTTLNVGSTINALENAYTENPNNPLLLKSTNNTNIRVYTIANGIRINGLKGNEKINLYDITGRKINIFNPSEILLNKGIYLVKVDNYVTKIIVR